MTIAAHVCRDQGWAVGDTLEGDISGVLGRFRITAIGASAILVRRPGCAEFACQAKDLAARGFRKVASARRSGR